MSGATKIKVRVADMVPLNELVTRFKFEPVDGGLLPAFSGGAHTVIEMQDQGRTRLNPYSLMWTRPTARPTRFPCGAMMRAAAARYFCTRT